MRGKTIEQEMVQRSPLDTKVELNLIYKYHNE